MINFSGLNAYHSSNPSYILFFGFEFTDLGYENIHPLARDVEAENGAK